MPRARNRAPSPQPVEPEWQEVEQGAAQSLTFNEPLTWRPGKQIPVTDLLRRLKALSEELQSIDQDDANRDTLVPKAQELADLQLIGHKDKGVKAYALLCIVDMFRLLAPDAPYKGGQLKEIFSLFTSTIVPALANPSDPYNQQHNAIMGSLTSVKSIVLLTDIPGADSLVLNLFTNSFDVMSGGSRAGTGEELPKNLEYHVTNMLCTVVEECASLPAGVTDIILAQFLRADPNSLTSGNKKGETNQSQILLEVSPAYNMARSVCNTCTEQMNRAIGQYFSSVLINASETVATSKGGKPRGKKRTHDESEDELDDGLLTPPAEDDLHEVEKAHRLLRELWRSSPDAIQNVVPQIEAEVEAASPQLRVMAVQTVGDMIAGIGAAGPPPPTPLVPAAYPSQSLDDYVAPAQHQNVLLDPKAPLAFSSVYSTTYQRFVERHKDKAPSVRSAWVTEAGRIISTSQGGKGLDQDQEMALLGYISQLLLDTDEKVRLSAVQAIGLFDFKTIVQKLGKTSNIATSGSILGNLADRIKDPKHHVRIAATELLARIWGVASGAIAEGNERIHEVLGSIPSKIFEAVYINNREINALVLKVLYDSLLPVSYPPNKAKQASFDDSQPVAESQALSDETQDPDGIRAERILVLVRDLEERAKAVFFKLQQRRAQIASYMESYLEACERINGAEKGETDKEEKKKLDMMITGLAGFCADTTVASEHLKKFAKHHDRRSYQLIRFCYDPASDYKRIFKAMKELMKRMEEAPSTTSIVLETILPLVRIAAMLVYNKSHVPAIVQISRTDTKGLGTAAHDVLKEISTNAPHIFKVHVQELCESLKGHKHSTATEDDPAIVDTLKACAGFARRFPEGMPKDRDFYKAMVAFAVHGRPPKAAKHAVTVVVSSAEKKEMYIKEIQKACIKNFVYDDEDSLSKLATISQLRLLANKECRDFDDNILDIAINQVLGQVRTVASKSDPQWPKEVDDDISAKLWALKILVNGLRGFEPDKESENTDEAVKEVADRVYKLLNTLIKQEGELSKTNSTPEHHKAQLRLSAAVQLLKLSCNRNFDHFLTQGDFNRLSHVAQDAIPEVRAGFVKALKKYLGTGVLPNRFYALVFLYGFEPTKGTMQSTATWLKSRAAMSAKLNDGAMEAAFARFLSLLAHHHDFSTEAEHLEDFVKYIMFYLKNAATEANMPMLYHIAQRVKQVQDAIDPEKSDNLYILSDIAQAVILQFAELKDWSLQMMSGRVLLPSGLFQKLPSHSVAQEIAEKKYIPEDLDDSRLEVLVKDSLKPKKRRSDGSSTQPSKKPKPSTTNDTAKKLPVRKAPKPVKTPKKRAQDDVPSSERRKSTRASGAKNYAENDDSQDDDELEQWQGDEEKELVDSSTPPTSDPMPAPAPAPKLSARKARSSAKSTPQKLPKQMPAKAGRATRAKKEKDIMDVPSDSD